MEQHGDIKNIEKNSKCCLRTHTSVLKILWGTFRKDEHQMPVRVISGRETEGWQLEGADGVSALFRPHGGHNIHLFYCLLHILNIIFLYIYS